MNNPSQKSFAERAQELKAREEAQAALARLQEQAENKQSQLLAAEGPEKARALAEEAIKYVKEQIRVVGPPFALLQHAQTNAQLEVFIREKWLLTGRFHNRSFTISTYNLETPIGSRANPMANAHVTYEIQIDSKNNFYWSYKTHSTLPPPSFFSTGTSGYPSNLKDGNPLAEFFLNEAIKLAEKSNPHSK